MPASSIAEQAVDGHQRATVSPKASPPLRSASKSRSSTNVAAWIRAAVRTRSGAGASTLGGITERGNGPARSARALVERLRGRVGRVVKLHDQPRPSGATRRPQLAIVHRAVARVAHAAADDHRLDAGPRSRARSSRSAPPTSSGIRSMTAALSRTRFHGGRRAAAGGPGSAAAPRVPRQHVLELGQRRHAGRSLSSRTTLSSRTSASANGRSYLRVRAANARKTSRSADEAIRPSANSNMRRRFAPGDSGSHRSCGHDRLQPPSTERCSVIASAAETPRSARARRGRHALHEQRHVSRLPARAGSAARSSPAVASA